MANSTELGCRIDEFVRELAEEFGELPESDEPLMTQIEDWAVEIGDAVMTRAPGAGDEGRVAWAACLPLWRYRCDSLVGYALA